MICNAVEITSKKLEEVLIIIGECITECTLSGEEYVTFCVDREKKFVDLIEDNLKKLGFSPKIFQIYTDLEGEKGVQRWYIKLTWKNKRDFTFENMHPGGYIN